MKPLITPESAFQQILSLFPKADSEIVHLENALHRVLHEPIRADRAIPPYHRSMMDGIAVDASTGLKSFQIAGVQAAGTPALSLPSANHCLEIMTGAVLPEGCNCVIPIEEVTIDNNTATLLDSCTPQVGDFVHCEGSDQEKGNVLVPTGRKLGAAELAISASCGAIELRVAKLPNIHLITSGDEVVSPEQVPDTFQIRSSHPIAIQTAISSQKLGMVTHQHLPDDPEATEQALQKSLQSADILILTGGVSKGKYDYIAPMLTKLCGESLFHGVAQKPGKPFGFFANPIPVFALPGNPLSVMACLARYVIPSLRIHLGDTRLAEQIPVSTTCPTNPRLAQLLAAKCINGKLEPSQPNNSGDYTAIAGCHGVMEIPPNSTLTEQDTADFYPWI